MLLGKNISKLIYGDENWSIKTSSQSHDSADAVAYCNGLEKVSSMPLNPETYPSLMGMLKEASEFIRNMDSELKQKNNALDEFEKKAEIRSIIDDMIESGLTDEYNVEEKVAELLTKDRSELKPIKEAVKISGQIGIGNLFDNIESSMQGQPAGRHELFDGIL